MTAPLEKIDLQGKVGGLKEWYEGCYEDLEAVAFSFVVEFKDGRAPMNMYADSEEEKVGIALNVLNLAGLHVQVQTFRTFENCGWTVGISVAYFKLYSYTIPCDICNELV